MIKKGQVEEIQCVRSEVEFINENPNPPAMMVRIE